MRGSALKYKAEGGISAGAEKRRIDVYLIRYNFSVVCAMVVFAIRLSICFLIVAAS